MAQKSDLGDWVMEAINALGGGGTVVEVCRQVWQLHENDLKASGDLFFTWQYDIRWAAQALRDQGRLMSTDDAPRGFWALANR